MTNKLSETIWIINYVLPIYSIEKIIKRDGLINFNMKVDLVTKSIKLVTKEINLASHY